jgi:hypothetical protein
VNGAARQPTTLEWPQPRRCEHGARPQEEEWEHLIGASGQRIGDGIVVHRLPPFQGCWLRAYPCDAPWADWAWRDASPTRKPKRGHGGSCASAPPHSFPLVNRVERPRTRHARRIFSSGPRAWYFVYGECVMAFHVVAGNAVDYAADSSCSTRVRYENLRPESAGGEKVIRLALLFRHFFHEASPVGGTLSARRRDVQADSLRTRGEPLRVRIMIVSEMDRRHKRALDSQEIFLQEFEAGCIWGA